MIRDSRNLEGKTCLFVSQDSTYQAYDGKFCTVIRRIDESSYDFEDVGTMWYIRMADGTELQAFADEVNMIMSPKEFIQKYMGVVIDERA